MDGFPTPENFRQIDMAKVLGETIVAETRGSLTVEVNRKSGLNLSFEQATKILENGFRALNLARQVSDKTDHYIRVLCVKRLAGYANSSYRVGDEFVNDEDDSQMAALLHELIENYLENENLKAGNINVIPQIAEFLFTGPSRLPLFREINDNYFAKSREVHDASWGKAIDIILPGLERSDPETVFFKLMERRGLSESEKIQIIKDALKQSEDARARNNSAQDQPSQTS